MQVLAIVFAALGLQSHASVGESEFFRLIEGLHGKIRDVSLICEGTMTFVGPKSLLQEGANKDKRYQCNYLYRNDSACRLDLYARGDGIDSPFIHSTCALLGDRLERLDRGPDQRSVPDLRQKRGTNWSLKETGSPHNIIWLWYFESVSKRGSRNFECQGWEEVDDHPCLRVQLAYTPGLKGESAPGIRFWIDMARGGHPLRVELRRGTRLLWRIHGIVLDRFKLPDGGEAWLPIKGVDESFSLNRKSYADPIIRRTYHVVPDTVRLNRELPDRVFSVAGKADQSESSGLLKMRREFVEAGKRSRASLPPRDPESVREQLDRQLAEADRQSKMLEASSTARSGWAWSSILPYGLSVGGVTLLGVVAFLKWRGQ